MPSMGLGRWQDIGVMNDIWQGVRGIISGLCRTVEKLASGGLGCPR